MPGKSYINIRPRFKYGITTLIEILIYEWYILYIAKLVGIHSLIDTQQSHYSILVI